MCQNPLGAILSAGDFLAQVKAGIDAADYMIRKLDSYERDLRYDDNQKQMLEQALRLYETGRLSKDQLKAIIDILPTNAPPRTVDIMPQQRRSEFDLSAMLQQLSFN